MQTNWQNHILCHKTHELTKYQTWPIPRVCRCPPILRTHLQKNNVILWSRKEFLYPYIWTLTYVFSPFIEFQEVTEFDCIIEKGLVNQH